MVVAYEGSAFHGFAPNPGVVTVGGTLGRSLRRILGYEPRLVCAGRTDAGVHAWGQVVSFDAADIDVDRVQKSLNGLCGPAIVVRSLEKAPGSFDARFSAVSRTYRYRVLNRRVPDPFLGDTSWHVVDGLDVDAMNRSGRDLLGEHDFSSFCRRRLVQVEDAEVEASMTREVLSVAWGRLSPRYPGDGEADLLELWITATAFCHQMVRSIAGTLVDVGRGRLAVDSIPSVLEARDRQAAGTVAPPCGLTLWSVAYEPN
jgi:tRNA pseudouridine38-40 synthase